ncbi:MAG: hypothetical protein Q9160_005417 [Pyrenula sp. 1 TL-2023]
MDGKSSSVVFKGLSSIGCDARQMRKRHTVQYVSAISLYIITVSDFISKDAQRKQWLMEKAPRSATSRDQHKAHRVDITAQLSQSSPSEIFKVALGKQRTKREAGNSPFKNTPTIFDGYYLTAAYNAVPVFDFKQMSWSYKKYRDFVITMSVSLRGRPIVLEENAPTIERCECGIVLQLQTIIDQLNQQPTEIESFSADAELARDFMYYYRRLQASGDVEFLTRTPNSDFEYNDEAGKVVLADTQIIFSNGATFGAPVRFAQIPKQFPQRVKQAQTAAFVVAAHDLKQTQPDIWRNFLLDRGLVASNVTTEVSLLDTVAKLINKTPKATKSSSSTIDNDSKDSPLGAMVNSVTPTSNASSLAPRIAIPKIQTSNSPERRPSPVIEAPLRLTTIPAILEVLDSIRLQGLPDNVDDESSIDSESNRSTVPFRRYSNSQIPHLKQLRKKLPRAHSIPGFEARLKLPVRKCADDVLSTINVHQVSNIVGATGSGKTTQIPQIIFESHIRSLSPCRIICTQPRRIATKSIAQRVAKEFESLDARSVGYYMRFEDHYPVTPNCIVYCTIGMLLQNIQCNAAEIFDTYTHLIIDECHERDLQQDILLTCIKRTKEERVSRGESVPKIILMSATLDQRLLGDYFTEFKDDNIMEKPGFVDVPGRAYPVSEHYLEEILNEMDASYGRNSLRALWKGDLSLGYIQTESMLLRASREIQHPPNLDGTSGTLDSKGFLSSFHNMYHLQQGEKLLDPKLAESAIPIRLICSIIAHVTQMSFGRAILVFLPGIREIDQVEQMLGETSPLGVDFQDLDKFRIYKLHASLEGTNIDVFESLPRKCRKVILATNIAEASITIPDVTHVIDSGRERHTVYNADSDIEGLPAKWISKSSSAQRRGRAGRVSKGAYYALFTQQRYETFPQSTEPQILRTDLSLSCLGVKSFSPDLSLKNFFSSTVQQPPADSIENAVRKLKSLRCLDGSENLTALGRIAQSMSLDPGQAKLVLLGLLFQAFEPANILGAVEEDDDWFSIDIPRSKRKTTKRSFAETLSDHLVDLNVYRTCEAIAQETGGDLPQSSLSDQFIRRSTYLFRHKVTADVKNAVRSKEFLRTSPATNRLDFRDFNANANSEPLLRGLILASRCFNLACWNGVNVRRWTTRTKAGAVIHPSSVQSVRTRADLQEAKERRMKGELICYSGLRQSRDDDTVFIKEITEISPLMVALFGSDIRARGDTILVDGWLEMRIDSFSGEYRSFHVSSKSASEDAVRTVIELRKALDRFLALAFSALDRHIRCKDPVALQDDHTLLGLDLFREDNPIRKTLVNGIKTLLEQDLETLELRRRLMNEERSNEQSVKELVDGVVKSILPLEDIEMEETEIEDVKNEEIQNGKEW